MQNWFECKVRYEKTLEDGKQKKVNEAYMVDAMSFTEAEARINEALSEYISTEFHVTNIAKSRMAEIISNDVGENWYKCKVALIEYDEKSGKEKKVSLQILLNADTVRGAYDRLDESYSDSVSDYEIQAITKSNVFDIFPYNLSDKADQLPQNTEFDSELTDETGNEDEPEMAIAAETNKEFGQE